MTGGYRVRKRNVDCMTLNFQQTQLYLRVCKEAFILEGDFRQRPREFQTRNYQKWRTFPPWAVLQRFFGEGRMFDEQIFGERLGLQ